MMRLLCSVTLLITNLLICGEVVEAGFDGTDLGSSLLRIVNQAPCVRLFSSQGSVGCRTPTHDATTAPLYYMKAFGSSDQSAIQDVNQDMAVVIPSLLLNATVFNYLASLPTTKGIVVLNDEEISSSDLTALNLSPDVQTPQGDGTPSTAFTIDPTHAWNLHGNGLSYQSFDFPIVLALGDSINDIKSWAQQNNRLGSQDYPRWQGTFNFYFGPSDMSSTDCLTWMDMEDQLAPQCLPLGGQSVWGSLGGRTGLQNKPTVLLSAAMDGTSLFHDQAPSANEAVASIIALLAAISALSTSSLDLNGLTSTIAFALFQAEEWGFAGSRRFVNDLTAICSNPVAAADSRDGSGACLNPVYPSLAFKDLQLSNLAHVLALDQIGLGTSLTAIYDGSSTAGTPTTLLTGLTTAEASMSAGIVTIGQYDGNGAMPPTSLTSLVNADDAISGAILAGYAANFEDPRYHSHMDKASFLDVNDLTTVSTLVARTVWTLAGGTGTSLTTINADSTLVSSLLICLTEDWQCDLFKTYRQAEHQNLEDYLGRASYIPPIPDPPTFYSGVIASYQGLPLVQHDNDGSATLYASWTGSFNPSTDKVYTIPKALEASLRPWAAYTISQSGPSTYQHGACSSTSDCSGSATCDNGLSTYECINNLCICRSLAFYHTALDPGLKPKQTPDLFEVADSSTPNWAEPNWMTIGLSVYPDTSQAIEAASLGVGIAVLAVSIGSAFFAQKALIKWTHL